MSQTKYILSLDQGTTSSRAILFDNEQNILCVQQREFEQIYPHQGWVEHNPMEIWSSQYGVMNEVIAQSGVAPRDIAGIGITNQRETTILWERATGRPVYNAIVWQCRRTAPIVDELLKTPGMDEYIRENTGLVPDAYFSATKIKWILDHVPGAREKAEAGELLFGTVDTWLVWKLTGGKVHVTDRTNASRTMLYNIRTLDWDEKLLQALDIPRDIAGIGITNQRETTILWERATGRPVYNAIVWQCRRTAPIVDELLKTPGMDEYIRENTGLVPDAYFSATKIKWILDHVPGAREKAEAGELLFGTVDTWLVWKLTGGKVHVTDRTNASRTMLYNIRTLDWDEKLLQALDIPRGILPEVRDSSEIYGYTNIQGVDVPVAGIAGDQQAALFGQGCFAPGDAKNTYGTGCFLLMNTGKEIYQSKNGLVTTVAISLNGEVEYALEGSVFVGGAVIQWIRDGMHMIQDSCDSEYYAQKVPDNGGVYIVPAFTGLGAPYWDMYARGAILGITRGTTQNHIIRAAEESIAYQSADLMGAMEKDTGIKIKTLKVDGGASRDQFLMQFQADILDKAVQRPAIRETTALGAAYLAGLATGVWKSREEITHLWSCNQLFEPKMDAARREELLEGWHKAVGRSQDWAKH